MIGAELVPDFLSELPTETRAKVRKGPCNVVFRFGNNHTVRSSHALLVPAGKWWIRIAVVPSSTPFLLSNSMFRSLGAVIDTTKQFKKLGCTIPMQLSARQLFLLNVCDLLRQCQVPVSRANRDEKASVSIESQEVLQVQSEGHHEVPTPHVTALPDLSMKVSDSINKPIERQINSVSKCTVSEPCQMDLAHRFTQIMMHISRSVKIWNTASGSWNTTASPRRPSTGPFPSSWSS